MNVRFHFRTILLLLSFVISASFAQSPSIQSYQAPPKRELRGAWIATVSNVDWPSTDADTWLLTALDSLVGVGVNAIFFQVRPSCDAFYASSIEPWSQWFMGTQDTFAKPYDPLLRVISLCRDRGMEVHAWFNPYRAIVDTGTASIFPTHVSRVHPEWLCSEVGTKVKVLNPGLPAVRDYVIRVIMDVVRRYDVDGIHFDDYFYPYGGIGTQDSAAYAGSGSTLPLEDWRRQNISTFVHSLHDSIQAVKPWVKFGISPFGIWRNSSEDPNGSATNGNSSYSATRADTRLWLQNGWVDYMAPQVYWNIGYTVAKYDVLVPWWNNNAFGRHIYIGQAVYKADPARGNWPVRELANQIDLNRQYPNVKGEIEFSAKYFVSNLKTINDSLRATVYPRVTSEPIPRSFALVPTMNWKDNIPANPPDSFRVQPSTGKTYAFVRWMAPAAAGDGEYPRRYLVYSSTSLPLDFTNLQNVVMVAPSTQTVYAKFLPVAIQPGEQYYFAVTSLDRASNESAPTQILGWTSNGVTGMSDAPVSVPAATTLSQNFPNPFNPATLISFRLTAASFTTLKVYDLLGREVATLVEEVQAAGTHQVTFDGSRLGSGMYVYRLTAEGRSETKKMMLVK